MSRAGAPTAFTNCRASSALPISATRSTVSRDAGFSLAIDGPFAAGLESEADNLVLRAARLLAERLGIAGGAKFRLTKNLPVASGIGGGSADAAAALRGLCALYGSCPQPTCWRWRRNSVPTFPSAWPRVRR